MFLQSMSFLSLYVPLVYEYPLATARIHSDLLGCDPVSFVERIPEILGHCFLSQLIPVPARSKVWVCGRSFARIEVSNPPGSMGYVSCEYCMVSGRGLCDGPIIRPEESYRVYCV